MTEYDFLNNKLLQGKNVEITDINRDEVEDIRDIKIDDNLSANDRIIEYIKKVKNPYVFKTGNTLVRIVFNSPNIDFAYCMENIIKNNVLQS